MILIDADLEGSILHKGDRHLLVRGRLADGRHAGVDCDENGVPLPHSRLRPVDPSGEAYQGCVAAVRLVERFFGPGTGPGVVKAEPLNMKKKRKKKGYVGPKQGRLM